MTTTRAWGGDVVVKAEGNVVRLEDPELARLDARRRSLETQVALAIEDHDRAVLEHLLAFLREETDDYVRRLWRIEAGAKKIADEVNRRARRLHR